MRVWELPVFVGLALGLHLAAFLRMPEAGQEASGGGGAATITLTAASGQVAALVEEWETAPDLATPVEPAPAPPAAASTEPPRAPLPLVPSAPPAPAPALPMPALPDAPFPPRSIPEPPPVAAPPEVPEPEPEAEPDQAAPLRPVPRPARLAASAPPPPEPETPRAAEPAPAAPARAEERARGAGANAAAGQRGRAETTTASPGARARLIDLWAAAIQQRLQRALVYPRQAQMRRLGGTAVVELVVAANGGLSSRRLVASSGSGVLDEAALRTVDAARGFPPAPEGLTGDSFSFRLPVVFQSR